MAVRIVTVITVEKLAERIRGAADDSDWAASLHAAALATVEEYAPGAPDAVKSEAMTRYAGYLAQSDFGGIRSETSVGGKAVEYMDPTPAIFRRSGAMGLLSRWKIRRAGAIG